MADSFTALLHRLQEEHEQQVTELRRANRELLEHIQAKSENQAKAINLGVEAQQDYAASKTWRTVRFEEDPVKPIKEQQVDDHGGEEETQEIAEEAAKSWQSGSSLAFVDPMPMSDVKVHQAEEKSNADEAKSLASLHSSALNSRSADNRQAQQQYSYDAAKSVGGKPLFAGSGLDMTPSTTEPIELHSVWVQQRRMSIRAMSAIPVQPTSPGRRAGERQSASGTADNRTMRATAAMLWPGLIMHPNAPQRVAWDVLGMVLVSYDVVIIPLHAFNMPQSTFIDIMTWLTATFWSFDVAASFMTGFHSDGAVVMNPGEIARHYMKTWLPFDVLLCLVDWALLIAKVLQSTLAQGDNSVGYARVAARAARFLRVLRLLRLVKLQGILNEAMERIQSEFWVIMLGIVRLVVFILVLNHMIACVWYWIGTLSQEEKGLSWVEANDLKGETLGHRYATALHWSLTQFTPASMEVVPQSEWERFFTICVLIFAMVTFSSFISSITNAMTRLRMLNRDWNEQQATLRRYLCENQVSSDLMVRIWGCLDKVMQRSKHRIHESDVTILSLLPWSLRADLQAEVYEPLLGVHPFFATFMDLLPSSLVRVYETALQEVSLSVGHELFHAGSKGEKMYFIIKGALTYNWYKRHSDFITGSVEQMSETISDEDWVSEACLWVKWQHCGQLLADSHCELLALSASKVHDKVGDCDPAASYARLFYEHIRSRPEAISDVLRDKTVLEELADKAFGINTGAHRQSYSSDSSRRSDRNWSVMSIFSKSRRRRPTTRSMPGFASFGSGYGSGFASFASQSEDVAAAPAAPPGPCIGP